MKISRRTRCGLLAAACLLGLVVGYCAVPIALMRTIEQAGDETEYIECFLLIGLFWPLEVAECADGGTSVGDSKMFDYSAWENGERECIVVRILVWQATIEDASSDLIFWALTGRSTGRRFRSHLAWLLGNGAGLGVIVAALVGTGRYLSRFRRRKRQPSVKPPGADPAGRAKNGGGQ